MRESFERSEKKYKRWEYLLGAEVKRHVLGLLEVGPQSLTALLGQHSVDSGD